MRLILTLLLSIVTSSAFANTIFEPTVTLGRGSGDLTVTNPTAVSASGDGTLATFGFRYGITRRYIHVTGIVEGTVFMAQQNGQQADTQFKAFYGVGIGYEWNIPIRTYLIAGAYDGDTDFVGTGAELAYFLNDKFWLGVRYLNYNAGINQDFTIGTTTTNVDAKVDFNMVSLIFSFPIEFNYPDHWFRKTDWQ